MKFNFFHSVCLIAVFLLVLQVFSPSLVNASETTVKEDVKSSQVYQNSLDNLSEIEMQQSSADIKHFFKGLAIGTLSAAAVGGTIIYHTGRAPAEWVAWGLLATELNR